MKRMATQRNTLDMNCSSSNGVRPRCPTQTNTDKLFKVNNIFPIQHEEPGGLLLSLQILHSQ